MFSFVHFYNLGKFVSITNTPIIHKTALLDFKESLHRYNVSEANLNVYISKIQVLILLMYAFFIYIITFYIKNQELH